ncbi:DUF3085 domain-containing protein [Streptomyces botrytidirepellens]|uniref:DUF3085 domain-containing protein n=1 Tax=Streptomyces botrytidirepellens TaxID=2486417 RepID=A0A3M8V5Y7_9ACTN|nr:DUF3085 domain-containing protein [Streptomyces botrytidirepellens]RNG12960.1 DUF3085 domain-containing protein [Streptomyces botrytidirepellens]
MTNPTINPEDFNAILREVLTENAPTTTTPHTHTLAFPLHKVLAAAEHATAAPKHALGPRDTDPGPRLWWINGDGIYLMSNGIYNTPNTHDETGHWRHIAHADNCGPGTDPSTVLGGDGLHETLDLTHAPADGQPLINTLRTAATGGATRFLLHITYNDNNRLLTTATA